MSTFLDGTTSKQESWRLWCLIPRWPPSTKSSVSRCVKHRFPDPIPSTQTLMDPHMEGSDPHMEGSGVSNPSVLFGASGHIKWPIASKHEISCRPDHQEGRFEIKNIDHSMFQRRTTTTPTGSPVLPIGLGQELVVLMRPRHLGAF